MLSGLPFMNYDDGFRLRGRGGTRSCPRKGAGQLPVMPGGMSLMQKLSWSKVPVEFVIAVQSQRNAPF
ncbi:hypothetical protein VNO77_40647 [Canavalia gladiata]|uniref:Uncharacterized protein n=1 Tax=Canavalia gladiata TaxID=3824 RepID=A0AAN9K061_CANGL